MLSAIGGPCHTDLDPSPCKLNHGILCKMSIMSNSRILPLENSFSKYISEDEGASFGACHLYNHLRPFMFGEDVKDIFCSFPSALEIQDQLSIPNEELRWVLVKFLEFVCTRAIQDTAITLREEFVQ